MSEPRTPLAPAALHILSALAGEDLHGYAVMKDVERQTDGRLKIGPGTLYDNLQRLTEQGLVRPLPVSPPESRRRRYRLTAKGKRALALEIQRLERLVRETRERLPGFEGA